MDSQKLLTAQSLADGLIQALGQVIRGKPVFLQQLVVVLLSGGHVLLEDLPGLGKTTAAKALAQLVYREGSPLVFRRIQFTPDLLPYDLTGVDIYNPQTHTFEFTPGPIFAQIILADEINRATPKVHSALLEIMEEHQVTVGTVTRPLEGLFFVVATQNPVDHEGTYVLPSAQMDRFTLRLTMGYPPLEEERRIILRDPSRLDLPQIRPLVSESQILEIQAWVDEVRVDEKVQNFVLGVLEATRHNKALKWGASPRAGVQWIRCIRARALVQGRDFATDEDALSLALPVLSHRLSCRNSKEVPSDVLAEILRTQAPRFLV